MLTSYAFLSTIACCVTFAGVLTSIAIVAYVFGT